MEVETKKTPKGQKSETNNNNNCDQIIGNDDFFVFQNSKHSTKLGRKPLKKVPLTDILVVVKELQDEDAEQLQKVYREKFIADNFYVTFLNELQIGFNIILYGYGSKKNLLSEFEKVCQQHGPTIPCYGYMALSFLTYLKHILTTYLRSNRTGHSINDSCSLIESIFGDGYGPKNLYMIIHNIDAKQFQNPIAQNVIERLSKIPQIHILASVDHINSPLLYSINPSNVNNWIWHQTDTFEKYQHEVKFMSVMADKMSTFDSNQQESVMSVITTLPNKMKKIFCIIALHFISNPKSPGYPESEFFEASKKEVFGIDMKSFLGFLTEYLDHKIITKKKLRKVITYNINLENDQLKGIYDSIQEQFEKEVSEAEKQKKT